MREVQSLVVLALGVLCRHQQSVDAGLLRDALSVLRLPCGSYRISKHAFVEWTGHKSGDRSIELGTIESQLYLYPEPGTIASRIYLYPQPGASYEIWSVDGLPHRTGGPAFRVWGTDRGLRSETYYVRGGLHRIGAPAISTWHDNGHLWHTQWYEDGKRHRDDNDPAVQVWSDDGRLKCEEWHRHGRFIERIYYP